MVGLVVVSHSRALASAAVALAKEMTQGGEVRIRIAAGLDDTTLGTDAAQVADAVCDADDGSGVVVLMDLGSAVLSAELALELLDDEMRGRVVLSPAPLVEGLVVAAVTASGGARAQEVAAEAADALEAKRRQLKPAPLVYNPAARETATRPGVLTGSFILGSHGLHARPAAGLVDEVRRHGADVRIRNRANGSAWVSASSLTQVMGLDAQAGAEVELRVSGRGAADALRDLLALANRNFGESGQR